MSYDILNHWIGMLKLLSKYFDHEWLCKNRITIDLNELRSYVKKLYYIAQYLDYIADYMFIKSVDPVPSKHIDIDVLVFNDLEHVVHAFISKGFRVKKIDCHSVTLIHTEMGIELDVHSAIRVPLLKIIPLQKVEIDTFYGFKIPEPFLLAAMYLGDIVDKKLLYGSHVLNLTYILALIKGVDFESMINRYRNELLSLPKKLGLRGRMYVLNAVVKYFRRTGFKICLASIESIVKDLVHLLT